MYVYHLFTLGEEEVCVLISVSIKSREYNNIPINVNFTMNLMGEIVY